MSTLSKRSVLKDSRDITLAISLIQMGARVQMLESETNLSYEKILKLYKEVAGKSPSKGQLPFSTDWFLGWQPNIHASLFLNIYHYMSKISALDEIEIIVKAFHLYTEQITSCAMEPLLSITRAWRLIKFVDNSMLGRTVCKKCGGHFVTDIYENAKYFECGLCMPPARAGKGSVSGGILLH